MPALAEEYEHVTPEYKTLPGWSDPTYGVRDGVKLPKAALDYLRFISDFLQVEIGMISTGPERDATIVPAGTLLGRWLWREVKRRDAENAERGKQRRECKRVKARGHKNSLSL